MTQLHRSGWTAGDSLWLVERRGRENVGRDVIVQKVGRKWLSVADPRWPDRVACRIDRETLHVDQGSGVTCAYRSREDYEQTQRLDKAWSDFVLVVRNMWRRPDHLTLEQIVALRASVFRARGDA